MLNKPRKGRKCPVKLTNVKRPESSSKFKNTFFKKLPTQIVEKEFVKKLQDGDLRESQKTQVLWTF